MDGAGNIDVTAPNTMTLNIKNLNINVEENMTTNVNMSQINTVGMSQTESIGAVKSVTEGGNFMTNVVGSLIEFVKGNRESKAKEVKENSKRRQIISQENNDVHSQTTFNNNSGENSKMY